MAGTASCLFSDVDTAVRSARDRICAPLRRLVVGGGGSLRTALVGDSVAALAVANGWAGIVVNGAVRDVIGLAVADLGVLALGTCPRRGNRVGYGEVDVPVRFGDAAFVPGAMLYADEDGVLVVGGDSPADA